MKAEAAVFLCALMLLSVVVVFFRWMIARKWYIGRRKSVHSADLCVVCGRYMAEGEGMVCEACEAKFAENTREAVSQALPSTEGESAK